MYSGAQKNATLTFFLSYQVKIDIQVEEVPLNVVVNSTGQKRYVFI